MRWHTLVTTVLVVIAAALAVWLFLPETPSDVVLYCSVDQDQSLEVVDLFQQETGATVKFQGDMESDKSVGLAKRLLREKDNPQADVFWANEPMHTAWLADAGVFDVLPEDVLAKFPE